MDYLHEIARALLPGVRRAALAPMHSLVLRALADRCEELIEAREEVLRTERQAASRPALVRSKVGGTGAQLDPATPPSEAATVTPGEGSTDTLHKTGATPPERPDSPSIEVPDAWLKASHTRAVEFLADALAESPDQIPLAIHAAAPEIQPSNSSSVCRVESTKRGSSSGFERGVASPGSHVVAEHTRDSASQPTYGGR